MNITIRRALKADIPILKTFQENLAFETEGIKLNPETLQRGLETLFQDKNRGFYSVAEANAEIVGCFMITLEWSDWRNGWAYWLQSVYVKGSYRKHGVFRKMFEHIQEVIANDSQIVGLRLYVDRSNVRAQQVYAAMGMNGEHYTVFELMKG
jgi:ribosomal protein S18 acetylase RimI-like enzyme